MGTVTLIRRWSAGRGRGREREGGAVGDRDIDTQVVCGGGQWGRGKRAEGRGKREEGRGVKPRWVGAREVQGV